MIMVNPLVSVIIPCHNYGHFLSRAIKSVLDQHYSHWEAIVIDDGSTDNTREIVASFFFDTRIRYHYQPKKGLSAARNKGLELSSGSWVQFLDADDCIHPQKLSVQLASAITRPEVGIWFTSFCYFSNEEELKANSLLISPEDVSQKIISNDSALSHLFKYNLMVVNAALSAREPLKKAGLFDEGMRSLEDWDYWIRAAFRRVAFGEIVTNVPLAFVRKHPSSMSTNRAQMFASRMQLFVKTRERLESEVFERVKKNRLAEEAAAGLKFYIGDLIFEEIQYGSVWQGIAWILRHPYRRASDVTFLFKNGMYFLCKRLTTNV